jgi:hypothetical protein
MKSSSFRPPQFSLFALLALPLLVGVLLSLPRLAEHPELITAACSVAGVACSCAAFFIPLTWAALRAGDRARKINQEYEDRNASPRGISPGERP